MDDEQKRPGAEPGGPESGADGAEAGAPAASGAHETAGEAGAGETGAQEAGAGEAGAQEDGAGAGGLRLLGAAVTLPWVFLYGVTGVWAVALAARAAGRGLRQLDAGYTRFVTPPQLAFVGALLLAAFAVLLACGLLLLFRRRSRAAWLPLLVVATVLTAGAVWAGIAGDIHPLMWALLFFGLVYAAVVALVQVLQVTRAERRGRIVRP